MYRLGNIFFKLQDPPSCYAVSQRHLNTQMNLKHCGRGRLNYTLIHIPLIETKQVHRDTGRWAIYGSCSTDLHKPNACKQVSFSSHLNEWTIQMKERWVSNPTPCICADDQPIKINKT